MTAMSFPGSKCWRTLFVHNHRWFPYRARIPLVVVYDLLVGGVFPQKISHLYNHLVGVFNPFEKY